MIHPLGATIGVAGGLFTYAALMMFINFWAPMVHWWLPLSVALSLSFVASRLLSPTRMLVVMISIAILWPACFAAPILWQKHQIKTRVQRLPVLAESQKVLEKYETIPTDHPPRYKAGYVTDMSSEEAATKLDRMLENREARGQTLTRRLRGDDPGDGVEYTIDYSGSRARIEIYESSGSTWIEYALEL